MLTSFKGLLVLGIVPLLVSLSFLSVWVIAGALGWGWIGRFVLEVVYHLILFKVLVPPMNRAITAYLRPFVWDELDALADQIESDSKNGERRVSVVLQQ
jgi:hypothetical protein